MATAIAFEADTTMRQNASARSGAASGSGKDSGDRGFADLLSKSRPDASTPNANGREASGRAGQTGGESSARAALSRASSFVQADGGVQADEGSEPAQVRRALQQVIQALRSGEIPSDESLQALLGEEADAESVERLAAMLMGHTDATALDTSGETAFRPEGDEAAAVLAGLQGLQNGQSDPRAALQAALASNGGAAQANRGDALSANGEAARAAQQTGAAQHSGEAQQARDSEAARQTRRSGEDGLRVDLRSADRPDGRGGDGRFSGQRVSVTFTDQGSNGAPQTRLSGDTALTAQAAQQASEAETTRNSQLRSATSGGTPSQQARIDQAQTGSFQSVQGQSTQGQAAQSQGLQAQTAQANAAESLDGTMQARMAAQAVAEETAEARQNLPRGEAQAGGASAAGTGGASAGGGQAFDPVMQTAQTQANANTNPNGVLNQTHASQQAAQHRPTGHAPLQNQIAVQIQRAAGAGDQRLSIRLNPSELGRIDVKLEMSDDGRVRAALSVERPETLDMLQRDVRGLERALHDAGLKTDGGSLTFDLEGGAGQNQDGERDHAGGNGGKSDPNEDGAGSRPDAPLPDSANDVPSPLRLIEEGLDIRV